MSCTFLRWLHLCIMGLQVIKDWTPTLFRAQLVPAAHVYCGLDGPAPEGGILRAEITALRDQGRVPPRPVTTAETVRFCHVDEPERRGERQVAIWRWGPRHTRTQATKAQRCLW